jgi:phosphotransferase system enzyme I (PtsP)
MVAAMSERAETGGTLDRAASSVRHSDILQTLIDISRIITTSHDLDETLRHTVDLIATRMSVDVCSIYIHNAVDNQLVLQATHGLAPSAVGEVKMPVSEGLIGLVLERQAPVNVRDVSKHPRFKFFPDIAEEELSSLLGVPLIEYRRPLGVLVIQNRENRLFSPEEENMLVTIASQISGLVSKALLVDRIQQEAQASTPETRPGQSFQMDGIPVAPGLAKDKVVVLTHRGAEEPEYSPKLTVDEEKSALQHSLRESEQEILELIHEVSLRVSEQEAAIFHAHLLFLEDRTFLQRIYEAIDHGASAAWSVWNVVREYLKAFQSIEDPYLKERGADLQDVGNRLLKHLGFGRADKETMLSGIVVAELLTPSDTARMDPKRIKGIITASGGYVSHAAILARSFRIPAVSGVKNVLSLLRDGEEVLLDGQLGRIFVNPTGSVTQEYERYQLSRREYLTHLDALRSVPCTTKDGQRVFLRANVGLAQDLTDYATAGADGVGLYRTEVFYLMRDTRPSAKDLQEAYAQALEVAKGQTVVFRTLDLAGDRFPTYLDFPKEDNPILGCRSLRYQLRRQGLLKEQFKAMLHVAHLGDLHLMLPMITHLDELQEAKHLLNVCCEEVEEETGREIKPPPVGMMFEVPASILRADLFAGEIDFFSVGSNDLTQYILAVDRNNPHVNHLYDPLDPAVLMMIQRLVDTASRVNKPLQLVGEVASDPEGCLVLVGLGVRDLSMNSPLIPIVKDRLSNYTLAEMEKLARIALGSTSAADVRRNLHVRLHG